MGAQENKIIQICREGMKKEKEGKQDEAQILYMQAWNSSSSDYERCVSAHFVSRQKDPDDSLEWNLKSLQHADSCDRDMVASFYPSLYFCVGFSYERLKNLKEARKYYNLADQNSSILLDDEYGKNMKESISEALIRMQKID